jgi:hypothetical protein
MKGGIAARYQTKNGAALTQKKWTGSTKFPPRDRGQSFTPEPSGLTSSKATKNPITRPISAFRYALFSDFKLSSSSIRTLTALPGGGVIFHGLGRLSAA